jgi:hypothetical protein
MSPAWLHTWNEPYKPAVPSDVVSTHHKTLLQNGFRIPRFVDRASRYMRVMKPTWCTVYLQFVQSHNSTSIYSNQAGRLRRRTRTNGRIYTLLPPDYGLLANPRHVEVWVIRWSFSPTKCTLSYIFESFLLIFTRHVHFVGENDHLITKCTKQQA